ncbi:MAG: carbon storage regulator [Bdellovibrionota bacterium]
MLVLSRKKDQTLVIDGVVELTVVAIRGNRVRLGLKGPAEYSFTRGELDGTVASANAGDGMLVLSRKAAQKIRIGGNADVVITVVKISGNTVRIGTEAPESVPVRRGELAA